MKTVLTAALLLLAGPAVASAQHQHEHARSPYADLSVDSRTTLSADEARALRAGEGMGLALVGELNGYPGPKHALELAEPLGLSDEQVAGHSRHPPLATTDPGDTLGGSRTPHRPPPW